MHRTIEITVPPTYTDALTEELEQLEHVITVSVLRGASIKPPGDVVTVHVLNRGADQVMSLADAVRKGGRSRSRRPSCPASSIPNTNVRLPTTSMKRSGRRRRPGFAIRAR